MDHESSAPLSANHSGNHIMDEGSSEPLSVNHSVSHIMNDGSSEPLFVSHSVSHITPTLATPENNRRLTMRAEGFYIPKDNPSKPQGEDSYFINHESHVIGLADGVGGWSKKGIDAGEYARELMQNAAFAVLDNTTDSSLSISPKQVLSTAFSNTNAQGSSTACIVALVGNLLRAVNLGDSGFLVIRNGKTVYRSPVQQYRFNYPYQLGKNSVDHGPEKAEEIEVAVEEGDAVIVGTDGLFDNIFAEEIEEIVAAEKDSPPDIVAWKLAMVANMKSLERTTVSPFQVEAYRAGIYHFGGKYDDITVVAAYIH